MPATEPFLGSSLRCRAGALLAAWVVQIFGTSTAIAALLPDYSLSLRTAFGVADDVGPVAKIAYVVLLAAMLSPIPVTKTNGAIRAALWACLSVLAVVVVLAVLPSDYSRGFGIGLTGARFDGTTLPIYLCLAALAGIIGAYVERRCHMSRKSAS